MDFTTYKETTETAWTSAATTQTGNFPSTVNEDDVLVFIGAINSLNEFDKYIDGVTDSFGPNTWGVLGTDPTLSVFYKRAEGTESGGTFNVSISEDSYTGACHILRFSPYDWNHTPEVNTLKTSGASEDPNPTHNDITPSWGSADNTFISAMGANGASNDEGGVSVYPSGTSNGTDTETSISDNTTVGSATLQSTNATVSIGGYTLVAHNFWGTFVIALGPIPPSTAHFAYPLRMFG